MKINSLMLTVVACASLLFNSCKKNEKDGVPSKEVDNPSSVMSTYFFSEKVSDFTLVVSTTHGVSLLEESPISKSSTSIQAFDRNSFQVGDLSVNDFPIPFSDKTYFLHTDENISATQLTGLDVRFNFNSSSALPSFKSIKYSPSIAELTYSGIENAKLKRNKDLVIGWKKDRNYKDGKALILVYGEDFDTKESKILTKEVGDYNEAQTISAAELASFNKFKSISIYFARGYNEIQDISGKSIEYLFINYSWSRIYFSK